MSSLRSAIDKFALNYLTSNLEYLRNRHAGESCYILGGGPSLKYFDLKKLDEEQIIGTNTIVFHKDFEYLKSIKYVSIIEPWYFQHRLIQPRRFSAISQLTAQYRQIVKNSSEISFFVNLSNYGRLNYANVHYLYRNIPSFSGTDPKLSDIDIFSGTITASVCLAYFLGYKNVHLIGFDAFTSVPSVNGSFYERGTGKGLNTSPNLMESFFEYFDKKMAIINVMVDKTYSSPVLNGITYEELTGDVPRYRENDQILKPGVAEIIDTCYPKYYELLSEGK
jgi:hypothetical protein